MTFNRVRWMGRVVLFGLLALLTVTSVGAQSSPSDIFVSEEAGDEGDIFESLQGFSGYGASLGTIRFYGSDAVDGRHLRQPQ